jgi:hypothetical protein
MQNGTLLQCSAERAVQAIFQVELAVPTDDVREQIAIEGRVVREHRVQVKHVLCGDQLVEPHRPGRDLCPFAPGPVMLGIRAPVPDLLKDHTPSLREQRDCSRMLGRATLRDSHDTQCAQIALAS